MKNNNFPQPQNYPNNSQNKNPYRIQNYNYMFYLIQDNPQLYNLQNFYLQLYQLGLLQNNNQQTQMQNLSNEQNVQNILPFYYNIAYNNLLQLSLLNSNNNNSAQNQNLLPTINNLNNFNEYQNNLQNNQNIQNLEKNQNNNLLNQKRLNIEPIENINENKNIENNNIQDNNEEIQKIKDLIDKKYDDVLKVIDELSTKIKNGDLLENKLQELINKMKSEKDNKPNNDEQIEKNKIIGLEMNKEIKKNISELKERINELNNKIDDIDNNYKNLLNESGKDIDTIKTKLNEVDSILEKKISINGWKSLLNKINEHEDMIKFLQDSVAEFKQSIKKFMENNSYFGKRLEDLTHEIMQKKGKENKQTSSKSIDVNKSFDENKYKEVLKIMNKNIEDLIKSKNTLLDNIKEINDNLQLLETKEKVNRLEDDITTRITDLINTFSKKFIDKLELNKILRNIDIKIKALDTPQKDSENWILAKQPVGCFNCASCESNIKNANASSDYIPWNKYPQAERQYHLGQGFSHLLRKIGNDYFILNERKELNTDLEIGNIKNFNNSTYIKGNNSHFIFNPINRETVKRDNPDKGFKLTKGYRLPNVKNKRRQNDNLPLTDDEDSNNNSSIKLTKSPKIMRITKKNISGDFLELKLNKKILGVENTLQQMNSTSIKQKVKLDRIRSVPNFENP